MRLFCSRMPGALLRRTWEVQVTELHEVLPLLRRKNPLHFNQQLQLVISVYNCLERAAQLRYRGCLPKMQNSTECDLCRRRNSREMRESWTRARDRLILAEKETPSFGPSERNTESSSRHFEARVCDSREAAHSSSRPRSPSLTEPPIPRDQGSARSCVYGAP